MPRDALGNFCTRTAEERDAASATAYADFASLVAGSVSGHGADVSSQSFSSDGLKFLGTVAGLYPVFV